jgi:hypothetical protein
MSVSEQNRKRCRNTSDASGTGEIGCLDQWDLDQLDLFGLLTMCLTGVMQLCREEDLECRVADARAAIEATKRLHGTSAEPGFFHQLASSRLQRKLAPEAAGRTLEQRLLDGVPKVSFEEDISVIEKRNHNDETRMIDKRVCDLAARRQLDTVLPETEPAALEKIFGPCSAPPAVVLASHRSV